MFIELVDMLRCPRPHAESWLVVASSRMRDRDIMEGVLGCPVCHAEYPIEGGIARFDEGARCLTPRRPPDEAKAIRLAAFLDLTQPRGYVLLIGTAGSQARLLRELVDVPLLLVNPADDVALGGGLSGVTTMGALPLARGSAHGAAVGEPASDELAAAAAEVVRPGGRLVAPAVIAVPAGITELVRDDRAWVGERDAGSFAASPVPLERGSR